MKKIITLIRPILIIVLVVIIVGIASKVLHITKEFDITDGYTIPSTETFYINLTVDSLVYYCAVESYGLYHETCEDCIYKLVKNNSLDPLELITLYNDTSTLRGIYSKLLHVSIEDLTKYPVGEYEKLPKVYSHE